MIIYWSMILLSLAFAYVKKHSVERPKQRVLCDILVIGLPIMVAAFRYNNGSDYMMYANMFNAMKQGTYVSSVKTMEFGFAGLVKLCTFFSDDYFILFFVTAVIMYVVYYKGIIRMSDNYVLSILLFFVTGLYFDGFNGIRQYIAAAFAFFAIYYLIEGRLKRYILFVLIGTAFHYTCILMLLLYLVRKIRFNIKRSIITIVVVVAGGNVIYQIITTLISYTRYSYYLTSVEYQAHSTDASILYISAITILLCVLRLKYKHLTNKQEILFSLQIVCEIIVLLSTFIPLMWRVQYYFLPLEIIIIPSYLCLIPRKSKRRMVEVGVVLMYVAIVMIYGIQYNGWYDALPYNFIFGVERI